MTAKRRCLGVARESLQDCTLSGVYAGTADNSIKPGLWACLQRAAKSCGGHVDQLLVNLAS